MIGATTSHRPAWHTAVHELVDTSPARFRVSNFASDSRAESLQPRAPGALLWTIWHRPRWVLISPDRGGITSPVLVSM